MPRKATSGTETVWIASQLDAQPAFSGNDLCLVEEGEATLLGVKGYLFVRTSSGSGNAIYALQHKNKDVTLNTPLSSTTFLFGRDQRRILQSFPVRFDGGQTPSVVVFPVDTKTGRIFQEDDNLVLTADASVANACAAFLAGKATFLLRGSAKISIPVP